MAEFCFVISIPCRIWYNWHKKKGSRQCLQSEFYIFLPVGSNSVKPQTITQRNLPAQL